MLVSSNPVVVLVDFWDRLPDDRPAIIQSFSHYLETTQNSLMSSPVRHPFWSYCWRVMRVRASYGSRDPIYVTGPQMIDQAILEYHAAEFSSTYPRRLMGSPPKKDPSVRPIKILPCENWQRVTIGKESAWIHVIWKYLAKWLGIFKNCGDVRNPKCLMGIHHGTTMWF